MIANICGKFLGKGCACERTHAPEHTILITVEILIRADNHMLTKRIPLQRTNKNPAREHRQLLCPPVTPDGRDWAGDRAT